MRSAVLARTFSIAALTIPFLAPRPALATGGLFVNAADDSADVHVTAHRMAIAMTGTETIVWDQMLTTADRSGPHDVAWVIPVKPGSRFELSSDAWFEALEAATQPVVVTPPATCYIDTDSGRVTAGGGSETVRVVSQIVAGPYQAVTVRASQGEALDAWLVSNGYALPPSVQPAIDLYVAAGFDFMALRVAPSPSVGALQPIRIVTPGTDATLPMRLVVAGGVTAVDIELFVLGPSRVHPFGLPEVALDPHMLVATNGASNFASVAAAALATSTGFAWLTESSGPLATDAGSWPNPALGAEYAELCVPQATATLDCADGGSAPGPTADAGTILDASSGADGGDASDAGEPPDAPEDAAPEADAGATGTSSAPGAIGFPTCAAPAACDDWAVALGNENAGMLWVTRLHAHPLLSAVTSDLAVGATGDSSVVPTEYTTAPAAGSACPLSEPDPGEPGDCDVAAPGRRGSDPLGIAAWIAGLGLLGIARFARRPVRAPIRRETRR